MDDHLLDITPNDLKECRRVLISVADAFSVSGSPPELVDTLRHIEALLEEFETHVVSSRVKSHIDSN